MQKGISVLVRRISPVYLPGEMGRYVSVYSLSNVIGKNSVGISATFRDISGKEISGRIVDMSEEIAAGHFPVLAEGEYAVDTFPPAEEKARARMAKGGIR